MKALSESQLIWPLHVNIMSQFSQIAFEPSSVDCTRVARPVRTPEHATRHADEDTGMRHGLLREANNVFERASVGLHPTSVL